MLSISLDVADRYVHSTIVVSVSVCMHYGTRVGNQLMRTAPSLLTLPSRTLR